jgi:hypothetical protein
VTPGRNCEFLRLGLFRISALRQMNFIFLLLGSICKITFDPAQENARVGARRSSVEKERAVPPPHTALLRDLRSSAQRTLTAASESPISS